MFMSISKAICDRQIANKVAEIEICFEDLRRAGKPAAMRLPYVDKDGRVGCILFDGDETREEIIAVLESEHTDHSHNQNEYAKQDIDMDEVIKTRKMAEVAARSIEWAKR